MNSRDNRGLEGVSSLMRTIHQCHTQWVEGKVSDPELSAAIDEVEKAVLRLGDQLDRTMDGMREDQEIAKLTRP